jgi:uncharacterized Ntn-hydrolase superfamily protein
MTFSIAARCERTGMFGVAVSSSSPCVAARCAHARAGVGAVSTQNITDPTLGPRGLDLMATRLSAGEALEALRATASHIEYRQLALVDSQGRTAVFSGTSTLGVHHAIALPNVTVAGNLLSSPDVLARMTDEFLARAEGELGDRLIAAMMAGMKAGGEAGPVHSAGMILVRDVAWPIADLRIDWRDDDPIGALDRLWRLWRPQMEAYVTRALDPSTAPSYEVPGDR